MAAVQCAKDEEILLEQDTGDLRACCEIHDEAIDDDTLSSHVALMITSCVAVVTSSHVAVICKVGFELSDACPAAWLF